MPPGATAYVGFVAEMLMAKAGELGYVWSRRASRGDRTPEAPQPADVPAELSHPGQLLRILAEAALGGHWHDQVMRAGWTAGNRAFRDGTPLYQLLKELDGGVSLLLGAADAATREYAGEATAADGLAVARRLCDAASLLRLAAAGGYARAMSDELRQRYRAIRHDLRNPLGTITSAVALMEDESVPEERRKDPRMHAMLARNARSMEAMIAAALGDAAAQLPVVAVQTTSLYELACAIRGELGTATDCVNVIVADDLPTFPLDSAGLELLLKAVVIAIARAAQGAVDVTVALQSLTARSVVVAVHAASRAITPAAEDLAFARELVGRLGGRVSIRDDARVLIEIPIAAPGGRHGADPLASRPDAIAVRRDGSGEARDDVARQSERADDEAGRL